MIKILFLLVSFIVISLSADDNTIIENKKLLQIKSNELVNKGMYKEAIPLIEKGIVKYPDNDYLLSLLGRSYKGLKDIEKAELYFQEALKVNPNNEFALAYIEETKRTRDLLKNDTQEKIFSFLQDKGVDLLFIFLGFLAGEIIATLIFRCNKENWKLIVYKMQLQQKQKLYMLNPSYIIKIAYKYFFGSSCPLKTILIYFTFLITFILMYLVYAVITESEFLLAIKTNQDFIHHIFYVAMYSTIILIFIWIVKITVINKDKKVHELKLLEIAHKMYQDNDIIELHDLLQAISVIYDRDDFEQYVNKYLIDKDEADFLLSNIK